MNVLSTTEGLFRVWVTDGIHTSNDASDDIFTVTSMPPDLSILSPADGTVVAQNQTVNLQALAYSDIAGVLDGEQIRWVSNLDGLIAMGKNESVTGLSVGTHTIVVRATDGERDSYADFQIIVLDNPSLLPSSGDSLIVSPKNIALYPHLEITSAEVSIANLGGAGTLEWQGFELENWLDISETSGDTPDRITISIDPSGLVPGTYSANIGFLTPDIPGGDGQYVTVSFNLYPEPINIFLPFTSTE
jgi:hypothetical protein